MEKLSFFERLNNWARRSVTLKLISIGILILILLIPTSMLESLIYERQSIRDAAIQEVSSKWGQQQTFGGPVLSIPYTVIVKDEKGQSETQIRHAHFLPDQLDITGTVTPEKRYRGIYVVVLYNTQLHVKGKFSNPNIEALNIPESSFMFNDASVSLGIPDMKGINDAIIFKTKDTAYSFSPGLSSHDIFSSGAGFELNLSKSRQFDFEFDINLNGSTSLNFLPFGKETNVSLASTWDSPSFEGSFLPDKRDVNEKGFTASWKVLQLNRNYPQQGLGSFITPNNEEYGYAVGSDASFGVRLLLPIDEYQKTTRSVKYCVMFIILTFLTFFFVEVLNKQRIHPIQYLLVGFAVCLFYVLLLSISEHLKFDSAYLIGCICILALITLYAKNIFKNNKLTTVFSLLLALLYGFFYSLMQLEDYSLLLGSIGLFIILGVVMYLTRKVDWYGISSGENKSE
ncbi:MAG: cell envelope integrity protein CreD [Bacteroidetes bacterium]|nr:MAG: cell envelope integrity protein CreD [Bacteroidota bacterium]